MELLAPVGNFECLKAAVQNGANSVYFGAGYFNARAFADNFDIDNLKEAIFYAKSRGVKTNLTLNTLLKNDEFDEAFELAKKAYEFGIDAIIVQDLGLAKTLIKFFPDLAIHASTQMSVHNLDGVLELQKLGFKRVVLSRELSLSEIDYICKHSNIEIECFIHGALCISYSGQCLFSSLVGGRSGNRGKCAQPCRLPYELYDGSEKLNSGYLLSTRDFYGLPFIPALLKSGVNCFKIEGRMKSPEYVATVTRIYRKYIDLAKSGKEYIIDEKDKTDLLQVFNRGNFSSGHLCSEENKKLIFKNKQNNMGLSLGKVQKYNKNKAHITLILKEPLAIGDTISLENETGTYTVSELMIGNQNLKCANSSQAVTIGRMKGNIKVGDQIYKISSKELTEKALSSFQNNNEQRTVPLNCEIKIQIGSPISIHVTSASDLELYKDLDIYCEIDTIPQEAQKHPLEKEKVLSQISKTSNSSYAFKNVNIILDDNTFLPNIKSLNELRRNSISLVEDFARKGILRTTSVKLPKLNISNLNDEGKRTISLLLNTLSANINYENLEGLDNIYIPLKYFTPKTYEEQISSLSTKFNIYIYLPTIIKSNYRNLFTNNIGDIINKYHIKGFVLSNLSNFELLKDFASTNLEFIANYTLNIFNYYTISEFHKLGIHKYTISPELDKNTIESISQDINQELIVYGRTPLMTMNYCPIGNSNRCYPTCMHGCNTENTYYLKDRKKLSFPLILDNIQTVSTLYNSKITSISPLDVNNINSFRIDILEENTLSEIQSIIDTVKSGKRFEGIDFTNGNLNKFV